MNNPIRTSFCLILLCIGSAIALDLVQPIRYPHKEVSLSILATLNDDVYSGDANITGEFAFNSRFSIWGATSYRFISYQYDVTLHDQIHEYLNLQESGLNASYLGFKYFPSRFWGFGSFWKAHSREGNSKEHFNQLSASLLGLYPFSPDLLIGSAIDFSTYFERLNYQPGKELGGRLSLVWTPGKWEIDHVFLYRKRINESLNLNMDKPYQKMDDAYSGLKIRIAASRSFFTAIPLSIGLAYEISRGNLFGFETGHLAEFFIKKEF